MEFIINVIYKLCMPKLNIIVEIRIQIDVAAEYLSKIFYILKVTNTDYDRKYIKYIINIL